MSYMTRTMKRWPFTWFSGHISDQANSRRSSRWFRYFLLPLYFDEFLPLSGCYRNFREFVQAGTVLWCLATASTVQLSTFSPCSPNLLNFLPAYNSRHCCCLWPVSNLNICYYSVERQLSAYNCDYFLFTSIYRYLIRLVTWQWHLQHLKVSNDVSFWFKKIRQDVIF